MRTRPPSTVNPCPQAILRAPPDGKSRRAPAPGGTFPSTTMSDRQSAFDDLQDQGFGALGGGAADSLDRVTTKVAPAGIESTVRCWNCGNSNLIACDWQEVIVASHAPALVLCPSFHVVELVPGYRARVAAHVRALAETAP